MGRMIHFINEAIKTLLAILLFVMVIVVFAQVMIRYALNHPLAWSEELSRYILVWISFLGAAYAMSKNAHVGVEVFVKLFSERIQRAALILSSLISVFFFAIIIYYGYLFSLKTMTQTSPVLQIPMGYIYAIIPISGVLLSINLFYNTYQQLRKVD